MEMKKPIDIELLDDAIGYFDNLPNNIRKRLLICFDKTKCGIKGHWFKNIEDKIWELKASDGSRFYRLLAFWDKTGKHETLIVATHGFNKKTNQTPKKEKDKAIQIRKKYFDDKTNKK